MNWSQMDIDRLYKLYVERMRALQAEVTQTNLALGSAKPSETKLEMLSRTEFEEHVRPPHRDERAAQSWLRRIVRGNEGEFPDLELTSFAPRRATGT